MYVYTKNLLLNSVCQGPGFGGSDRFFLEQGWRIMLNDSQDFTEPAAKKRVQPSGGPSKRAKKEVSNAVDPNNILVHPKWENAPFVTKLKALLKETPSSTDQSYNIDFKPEVHKFF